MELLKISGFISKGQLREFVEGRCRVQSAQVAVLRFLDMRVLFMEEHTPVARGAILRASSGESLNRAEIRRFADRVATRYEPPPAEVAVLLPCSARKPYSLSRSHRRFRQVIAGRAHELIVTSPIGLVPREIECLYPAMHYDVPVTGYWDAEEQAVLARVLARYFSRHSYRRVIAHLDGGALSVADAAAAECGINLERTCTRHPLDAVSLSALDEALKGERRIAGAGLRGMLSWQFGSVPDTSGITVRGRYPELFFIKKGLQLFSLDPATGMLRPTFNGWELIHGVYTVEIDDFVPEGDVLVPGVVRADVQIRDGDEVFVHGPLAVATGRATMSGDEMCRSKRGVAVRVRKVKRV